MPKGPDFVIQLGPVSIVESPELACIPRVWTVWTREGKPMMRVAHTASEALTFAQTVNIQAKWVAE